MTPQNLLVELLVEELPPKALNTLGEAFAGALMRGLNSRGLLAADSAAIPFASPRRLAAHISRVHARAPDRPLAHKLMPAAVAFDATGQATPALLKKLVSLGAGDDALPRLRRQGEGKAEAVFLDSLQSGVALTDGLQQALAEALAQLPIPKLMQYQLADGWTSVHFVRPAHGLVALHGTDVVPVTALGLAAGRGTQGHRFEAACCPVQLRDADSYAQQLRDDGAVIASFAERRAEVLRQLQAAAAAEGAAPIDDDALLDEVTALVERPNVLVCRFDPAFLSVPAPCLVLTMKANQKYFPLLDAQGALTERFLVVSNITPADASGIVEGNERVVRPRLADARFFFEQDRKKTLASRVAGLARVVYHHQLGTQGERVERVRVIAAAIAAVIGERLGGGFAAQVDQAAELAKADLLTDMVGEFPELQGTMGRYYALHDGLGDEVAQAIEDHYKPRFAGDSLPRSEVGLVVALADKLETLAGLFGIGELPTGDRDPFALRRHALGVIRMLVEKRLPLALDELIALALRPFAGRLQAGDDAVAQQLSQFLFDRLAFNLREQGWQAQEVDAVLSLRPQRLDDLPARLQAVRAFATLPEAAPLASANKRVGNILKKSTDAVAPQVDIALLREPAEAALNEALGQVRQTTDRFWASRAHTDYLIALAVLKQPVDAFFDTVMVNAEDPALRANRLALLAQLHQVMNRVADVSRLAPA